MRATDRRLSPAASTHTGRRVRSAASTPRRLVSSVALWPSMANCGLLVPQREDRVDAGWRGAPESGRPAADTTVSSTIVDDRNERDRAPRCRTAATTRTCPAPWPTECPRPAQWPAAAAPRASPSRSSCDGCAPSARRMPEFLAAPRDDERHHAVQDRPTPAPWPAARIRPREARPVGR